VSQSADDLEKLVRISARLVNSPCEMYGEEMSRYTMELIMKKWVEPSIDTSKWEYYDLSCKAPQRLDSSSLRLRVLPASMHLRLKL